MRLIEKYAPNKLNEVVFGNETSQHLINAIAKGEYECNVILHGPNGTGKTTTANLIAQSIGGNDIMVETKDFCTVLGMPDIKEYLKRCAIMAKFTTGKKYFVIWHEFDNTKANPHTLWTALDDLGADVMLILTTNNFIKIHQSLRSRCQAVEMPALKVEDILSRAHWILQQEGLEISIQQLMAYLKPQQISGDLRKYFAELDKLLYLHRQGLPMPPWNNLVTRKAMHLV